MIRKILILTCCFFYTYTLSAQSFVKGKITEKGSKEGLPGVIAAVGAKSILSDVDGNFLLNVPAGKQTFLASLVGYKTFKKELDLKEKDTLVLNIEMEEANQILEEVVVSAGRYEQKLSDITVSMEVIKPDLLQNKAVAQLDQIMGQVPGVYVTDGQISIRGGSGYTYGAGSRVIMLVDEMPMMSADAGDIKFNYIPIENMEQVEVIKGASSALFGSSALSGVINMRTKYARDKPETQVTTFTGIYGNPDNPSWNWWAAQHKSNPMYQGTTFSHAQKLGNFDLVIGGQLYNDEGYRDSASERRIRGNINLRYNFKKVLGLSIGVNSTIMEYNGNLFFVWKDAQHALQAGSGTLQNYDNTRNNIDPFIVYNSEKIGRHSFRTRYFLTDNTNHLDTLNQSSRAELYYGEYQWQKRFKQNFNFTAGTVAMHQVVLSNLYGKHLGQNYAGYFQLDKKFFNRLTASVGARAEYYKLDTSQTHGGFFLLSAPKKTNLPMQPVFRAGLNYQAFQYTFLRASFGQGYRFPSVSEKYISTSLGKLGLFPNNSLQPEKGWSAEVGIKQGFKISKFQAYLDVAGFVTHYYNMIDLLFKYDTAGKNPSTVSDYLNNAGFQFQNIGRANITGVDVSLNGAGKIGQFLLTVLAGFTYTNPINPDFNPKKDTNGTVISNLLRYRNKTMFKNDAQITYKKISAGWSIRYSSIMQNIDNRFEKPIIYDLLNPNTPFYNNPSVYVLPGLKQYRATHNTGVWVNDFRIGYQASPHLKLAFLINNIFNVEFMSRPGLIEPPRTFVFQANIRF
jgi:outer membrane receptor protein involved in Fe transport